MMSVLKRALPFILTLFVGVVVGSGLKERRDAASPAAAATQSCGMRKRQVMLMPPPPPAQSMPMLPAPLPPATLTMPPPPPFEGEVFTARDVTRKAFINYKPEPLYTSAARRNNVEGTVRLRIVLAADGSVRNIEPLTTLPDGLTEQAVEAARDIEFTPASKDGRAVAQSVTVEYNFNIY